MPDVERPRDLPAAAERLMRFADLLPGSLPPAPGRPEDDAKG